MKTAFYKLLSVLVRNFKPFIHHSFLKNTHTHTHVPLLVEGIKEYNFPKSYHAGIGRVAGLYLLTKVALSPLRAVREKPRLREVTGQKRVKLDNGVMLNARYLGESS